MTPTNPGYLLQAAILGSKEGRVRVTKANYEKAVKGAYLVDVIEEADDVVLTTRKRRVNEL